VGNPIRWIKARKSDNGGDCVEVAFGADGRSLGMVRDSKRPEAGHLAVTPDRFRAFLGAVKRGELDALGPLTIDPRLHLCSRGPGHRGLNNFSTNSGDVTAWSIIARTR
jgi:hypothetical protein